MSSKIEKIKCSYCLKIVSEADNCDGCEKSFCIECLTYHGEKDYHYLNISYEIDLMDNNPIVVFKEETLDKGSV